MFVVSTQLSCQAAASEQRLWLDVVYMASLSCPGPGELLKRGRSSCDMEPGTRSF